jgi:succinate-acetate transporter protein
MGYGFGTFLLALGLILALAVSDVIDGVDLTLVGWILAAAGVITLVLTAITANSRKSRYTETRHPDGSATVRHDDRV